jgi:high-affinity iron transporter
MNRARYVLSLLCVVVIGLTMTGHASADQSSAAEIEKAAAGETAPTILHLLDYVGVDYAGAVENGKIKSADEYKEMLEFAERAHSLTRTLQDNPARASLVEQAARFAKLIQDRASPKMVADESSALRRALVAAYRVQASPRRAPDLAKGAALYADRCSSCHGERGLGDGPAAKGLTPPPSNFHDAARMNKRGLYGLYNTISLGVANTAMVGFGQIKDDERWALAFHVASLGTPPELIREGEALWKDDSAMRKSFPNYASIVSGSPEEVQAALGTKGVAVQAYLRAHPEALDEGKPSPIAFARQRAAEALAAYEKGDRDAAQELAVSAYLEGFEIAESGLDNVDHELRMKIEREMMALRKSISDGISPAELRKQVSHVDDLLSSAGELISGGGLSPTAAFISALIILLREGLEAILLLAAIVAFITRTGRRDALPWVHAGWIGALALGAVTWMVATYFISISGANRELTEGVTALVACAMLLYVGYWLHGKAQAQAWSHFLRDQVDSALEKRTLRTMAAVSFIAVYREIFEVVLFYEALWVQAGDAGHSAVGGGIITAAVLLAITGWAIFRYSVRLPIGPFFTAMSLLLALMAVAFAGQGIKALQEAGIVGSHEVPFFTVTMLGIHPTAQTLAAQVLAIVVVALGYRAMNRQSKVAAAQI